jgi:hypothetical protein
MRRYAVLAALVLAAAPAAAQQKQSLQEPLPTAAPVAQTESPAVPRSPTLSVSREQIDAQLKVDPAQRASSQMTQRDFLYLVAAIAIGIIVAAVVLD